MPSLVENATVETVLRGVLLGQGFTLSEQRGKGETGVDIIATKTDESWYIECIGYKGAGPSRAKDFYESFFRAVSRLDDDAKHLVIAMSIRAQIGLPARAKQHKTAWKRIAEAFPELEIWLVDTDNNCYTKHTWIEWLK